MTASARLSPYEMLAAMRPNLLKRPPDIGAVSLLGQAVSDVLDDDNSESVVLQLIADLESARANEGDAEIHKRWSLPLVALLGMLRQHLHNRTVQAAAMDPTSITLRDKVLAALDAGIDTPTAIGEYVHSPTTVVSRVLRQLAKQGRVERAEGGEDKRRRPYRRVDMSQELSQLIDTDDESSPVRGIADIAALIDFAEELMRCNIKTAAALLPSLIAAGSDAHLSPGLRVSALGVAGVMVRGIGAPSAAEDALDLAETAGVIAEGSGDDLLLADAAYGRARAVLFATPHDVEKVLHDLQRAEDYAKDDSSSAAQIRLGWCAYTRGLIEEGKDLVSATEHVERARMFFGRAHFSYGEAAALVLLTRARSTNYAWKGTADLALQALSLANSHGYLRLMAESSFWAAELLSESDPLRAERLFSTAGELFESVGSRHWRALSYASRKLVDVRRDPGMLGQNAKELLQELKELQAETSINEKSWAAAVLNRWIGVCALYAQQYDVAQAHLGTSVGQYGATPFAPGLVLAKAGLKATERGHSQVEYDDLAAVLEDDDFTFLTGNAPPVVEFALERPDRVTVAEFGII